MSKLGVALTILLASNAIANDALRICKEEILSSDPYGKEAKIGAPSRVSDDHEYSTLDWDGTTLSITDHNGNKSISTARCVYSNKERTITFLNVYADTIISKYELQVSKLRNASKDDAIEIAKSIGLSDGEIEWLRHYGGRSFYGQYFPDDTTVIGFYVGKKSEIQRLDKLNVINLYPQHPQDHFLSVSTDFSLLLSEKLAEQP